MIELLLMITIICFLVLVVLFYGSLLVVSSIIRKAVKVNSGFNINFIHFYGRYACM